jgi:hypothetical protein
MVFLHTRKAILVIIFTNKSYTKFSCASINVKLFHIFLNPWSFLWKKVDCFDFTFFMLPKIYCIKKIQ